MSRRPERLRRVSLATGRQPCSLRRRQRRSLPKSDSRGHEVDASSGTRTRTKAGLAVADGASLANRQSRASPRARPVGRHDHGTEAPAFPRRRVRTTTCDWSDARAPHSCGERSRGCDRQRPAVRQKQVIAWPLLRATCGATGARSARARGRAREMLLAVLEINQLARNCRSRGSQSGRDNGP
jgi:hypothetical protein